MPKTTEGNEKKKNCHRWLCPSPFPHRCATTAASRASRASRSGSRAWARCLWSGAPRLRQYWTSRWTRNCGGGGRRPRGRGSGPAAGSSIAAKKKALFVSCSLFHVSQQQLLLLLLLPFLSQRKRVPARPPLSGMRERIRYSRARAREGEKREALLLSLSFIFSRWE